MSVKGQERKEGKGWNLGKKRKVCSYPLGWKWRCEPEGIMPRPLGRRGKPLKGRCPGGGGGSGGGGPCL